MKLTFGELKKKEVINLSDGKCLGFITDITIDFPDAVMVGITVPGKRSGFIARLFDKSEMFIPDDRIKRIGSDAILVSLDCGEVCAPSVKGSRRKEKPPHPCQPVFPCTGEEPDENDY